MTKYRLIKQKVNFEDGSDIEVIALQSFDIFLFFIGWNTVKMYDFDELDEAKEVLNNLNNKIVGRVDGEVIA